MIIILNGPSCVGKTSIQKEFQKLCMPDLWIKTGIDTLFDNALPDITLENMHYWQLQNNIRWVEKVIDDDNNPLIALHVGQEGEKVIYAMNACIAEYAKNGCNVIVDYIAYQQEWLEDLKKKLYDSNTIYVAITISLELLEQREMARGTSPVGHARSHYNTVLGSYTYDLYCDSGLLSAQEIAQKIKHFIDKV